MPAFILLAVIFAIFGLASIAGLVAERDPRVAELTRRLNLLSDAQRTRVGLEIAVDQHVPALVRLLPISAFVYWVTTFDLVPDFIPKIGYFDDRIVLALSLWVTLALSRRGLIEEHVRRAEWLAQEQQPAEGGMPPL